MKFKPTDTPTTYSSEPQYDLANGYIDPAAMLEDPEEAKRVMEAVQLVETFLREAEESGHLEVG